VRDVSRDEETRRETSNVKLIPSLNVGHPNIRVNGTSRPGGVRVSLTPLVRPKGVAVYVRRKEEIYEKDDSGYASISRVLGRNGGPGYCFDFAKPNQKADS
jgi:hypothetical protein